ncbi:MAG TPA: YbaK/EbsC family protein [Candidatus Eisenbacteria bacterium]|jgi:prolyl-tRNA editing enzyme YbaK/EbsC (Cys-tRNA(Pro) deacylase)
MSGSPGSGPAPLSASARVVQDAIAALGLPNQVIELAQPVRTAAEAAAAVGCNVRQIAKSLVFATRRSNRAILVVTSGANRVNEETVGMLVGEPIARARPDFVRDQTGFAIGGVPPLGHRRPIETFIDLDLMAESEIWAAAGHPNALFHVTPDELLLMSNGRVASVT